MAGRPPLQRHIRKDYIDAIRPIVRFHSIFLKRCDSQAFIDQVSLHAILRLHPNDMKKLTTIEPRFATASMSALMRVIAPFFETDNLGKGRR